MHWPRFFGSVGCHVNITSCIMRFRKLQPQKLNIVLVNIADSCVLSDASPQ